MSAIMSFLASAVPAVINGVTDALGMAGQSHYQRVNMRESARLQHEENKYWAEYNTPANQMLRLREAGLNPNLVYGNGADAQASGSVSPSGGMPNMRGGYGTDFLSFRNMIEQNRNLQAQNDLLRSQTEKTDEEKRGIELDNQRKVLTNPYAAKLEWDKHLNNVSERERNQAIGLYYDAQRDLAITSNNIQKEYGYSIQEEILNNHLLENAILELKRDNTQRMLDAEYDLTKAEKDKVMASIVNLRALSKLYDAQEKNEGKQYTLNDKKITEQHIKNEMLNLEKQVKWVRSQIETSSWYQFWEKWVGVPAGSLGHIFGSSLNFTPLMQNK